MAIDYGQITRNEQFKFCGNAQLINAKQSAILMAGYNATDGKAYYFPLNATGTALKCDINSPLHLTTGDVLVDIQGVYHVTNNPIPDSTGLIAHTNAATPAITDQIVRITGGINDADALVAANIWGLDSRDLQYQFNGTTFDRVRNIDAASGSTLAGTLDSFTDTAVGMPNCVMMGYDATAGANAYRAIAVDSSHRLIAALELNDYTDDSNEFTVASSKGLAIMALATTDAVDAGDIGALRMSLNRNLGVDISEQSLTAVKISKDANANTVTNPIFSTVTDGTTGVVVETAGTKKALNVNITDGTNDMPTMDANTRAGYFTLTDGTNEVDIIATINSLKTDLSSIAGTATSVNTGTVDAGTQRVTIATDDVVSTGIVTLAAVNFATETTLASVLADTTTLTGIDFATETTLASVLADTTTLTGKDFATETTLASVLADTTTLTGIDFATQTTLASLEGKDFATETTLGAINTKLVTGTVIGDVNAIQSGIWDVVSNSENIATESTLSDLKTLFDYTDLGVGSSTERQSVSTLSLDYSFTQKKLFGWNIINPNAYYVYVKIFDSLVADVTLGTTTIYETIQIPPTGSVYVKNDYPIHTFSTGVCVGVTKLLADNDTTAIDSAVLVQLIGM